MQSHSSYMSEQRDSKITKTPENPNAFPITTVGDDVYPGMTLRDYFAGQALPGVIQACASDNRDNPDQSREEYFARKCYRIADAMLTDRKEGE